jgi:hypothetical protein
MTRLSKYIFDQKERVYLAKIFLNLVLKKKEPNASQYIIPNIKDEENISFI